MFVSDRIVFLELHKTGTTHIRSLLQELVGGSLVGKHNRITPDLLDGSRIILGSIRDPWEWYVSLWAFGCDAHGDLYGVATKRRRIRGHGWRSNPIAALGRLAQDVRRQPEAFRRSYTNADDAEAFRRWLVLVLRGRLPDEAFEYGAPSIARFAGLLTYRYLHLFCGTSDNVAALSRLDSLEAASSFEREHNIVDHFIRNEALEDGLLQALEASGIAVSEAKAQRIRSATRTNTSSRRRETSYFYDAATAALVGERERILVERFGYTSPLEVTAAVAPEQLAPPSVAVGSEAMACDARAR